jgi:FkbH-like protein
MKELEYPFDNELILKYKKKFKRQLIEEKRDFIEKRIAILGGSTTNDIKLILELFLLNYGIKPEFYESEYNQYYQDAMFPNEKLEEFKPDIIFIHTTNKNITFYPFINDDNERVDELLENEFTRYTSIWERISTVYHCTVIQNNFELPSFRLFGNKDASDIHGRVNFISRLNMKFYEYAQTHTWFFINDINYLSAAYGLEKWNDSFYWHMYKYSPVPQAIPSLAFSVARIIKSVFGKNKKAFVLDLDNTLWGGIVGDDGQENLVIGQETSEGQVFSEFQDYLKQYKDLGVMLTVNSKNDYDNALLGLNHPDGILKPDDFIIIKANWEPKDKNLSEISTELNILPESLVFVDDNPAEREIVRSSIPGCAVPEITVPEHYIDIIDRSGFFEITSFSDDDKNRNEMYKKNIERSNLEASFIDYGDYLLSLNMHADIKKFEPLYMARIAQLTNKSNQFNLTTKRYTQPEIENVAASDDHITIYGKLEDKFGDNGVVSVVIGHIKGNTLDMELWIMSCRVLKRDMEFAMLDELIMEAKKRNITLVRGFYYPTVKNAMVKNFYGVMGFDKVSEDEAGNSVWEFHIPEVYEKKCKVINVEG